MQLVIKLKSNDAPHGCAENRVTRLNKNAVLPPPGVYWKKYQPIGVEGTTGSRAARRIRGIGDGSVGRGRLLMCDGALRFTA